MTATTAPADPTSALHPQAAIDPRQARRAFADGLDWFLAHAALVSPDSKMCALGGLILADPAAVADVRRKLEPPQRPNPVAELMAVVDRDPQPLPWDAAQTPPTLPDSPPRTRRELHDMHRILCHAAVGQSCLGRFDPPVLAWMRSTDHCGYNLAHQLLAWILCVKGPYLGDEAPATVNHLAHRLKRDLDRYPFVYLDLFAESLTFLALAGMPIATLTPYIRRLMALQDPNLGRWRYTLDPAELTWLLENAHLGGSPLIRAIAPYTEHPQPLSAFQHLEVLHHGHTTSLSLWTLGVLLAQPQDSPPDRA